MAYTSARLHVHTENSTHPLFLPFHPATDLNGSWLYKLHLWPRNLYIQNNILPFPGWVRFSNILVPSIPASCSLYWPKIVLGFCFVLFSDFPDWVLLILWTLFLMTHTFMINKKPLKMNPCSRGISADKNNKMNDYVLDYISLWMSLSVHTTFIFIYLTKKNNYMWTTLWIN